VGVHSSCDPLLRLALDVERDLILEIALAQVTEQQ
jgi:hypothetical protein